MARKYSQEEPETFREALDTGQILRWLKSQLIWGVAFLVLAGLVLTYVKIFHPATSAPINVVEATRHVQATWRGGDQAGAIAYYRKVADQGDPAAAYTMGVLYESAMGKLHDDKAAVSWFQRASDKNYAAAQRELSNLYRQGQGVARDDGKALKLLEAAAAGGDVNGQADLAEAHEDGLLGLPRDPALARTWYARAAARGSLVAQVNFSNLLFKGSGGAPDAVGAYRWAGVAAAHSEAGSEALRVASANAVAARARMTPEQLAAADAWVKAWKAAS